MREFMDRREAGLMDDMQAMLDDRLLDDLAGFASDEPDWWSPKDEEFERQRMRNDANRRIAVLEMASQRDREAQGKFESLVQGGIWERKTAGEEEDYLAREEEYLAKEEDYLAKEYAFLQRRTTAYRSNPQPRSAGGASLDVDVTGVEPAPLDHPPSDNDSTAEQVDRMNDDMTV
jgi:hypothetical protein